MNLRILIVLLFGNLVSLPVFAQALGTMSITVTVADTRTNPYVAAGFAASPAGARQPAPRFSPPVGLTMIPFRRGLVELTMTGGGNTVVVCRRTDNAGFVQIPWNLSNASTSHTATITAAPLGRGLVVLGRARL